jgi:hypothetical protein
MSTNTITWTSPKHATVNTATAASWQNSEPLVRTMRFGARLLLATAPALAILVASAWAVATGSDSGILQAVIWASGFIFFGLAIEAVDSDYAAQLFASGAALPVLALLSAFVAAEFALLAAGIIAAWVVTAILRRTA